MTRVLNKKYWPYAIEFHSDEILTNSDTRHEWLDQKSLYWWRWL